MDALEGESTIYAAKPWSADSEAIVSREPESGGLPADAGRLGLEYFLEVFIAREFMEGWLSKLKSQPSLHDKCARIIEYADTDA